MNNYFKSIILTTALFVSFVGTVSAAGASLTLNPETLTKSVGDAFNVSAIVTAGGNKVCVVEGTLSFAGLACSSISVADGVIAQSVPTCSNPHFEIGIPSCTTSDKALFNVSVMAKDAGTASIGFTKVDVVGAGVSLPSTSVSGTYTILAIVPKPQAVKPAVTSEPVTSQDTLDTTVKTDTTPVTPASDASVSTEDSQTSSSTESTNKELAAAAGSSSTPIFGFAIVGILAFAAGWFMSKKKSA